MNSRRNFLKSSAGLAATLAAGPLAGAQAPPAASLPKVRFGDVEISRLIIGQNPFGGGSHFSPLLDHLMADWNTPERVSQTLLQCQHNGINAYQCSNKGYAQRHMELFRAQGGKMHLIAIDASDKSQMGETVRRSEAGAFYHHGEVTDVLFREGKMEQVQEYTKRLRQTGVRVGIGTHKPEVVEYVEEARMGRRFLHAMRLQPHAHPGGNSQTAGRAAAACFGTLSGNRSSPRLRGRSQNSQDLPPVQDPCRRAAWARTPEEVDKAFKQAFDNIKPQDCIVVGMFPRFQDQVKENCDRVRRILNYSS